MERVIEFRGKRFNKNEWVYGNLVHCRNTTTIENEECGWVVNPSTIGQYTGLKDKNGKKIFEGDILKDQWNTIYVVKYKNSGFYIYRNNGRNGYSKIASWNGNKEVIGNIHDNPELWKE